MENVTINGIIGLHAAICMHLSNDFMPHLETETPSDNTAQTLATTEISVPHNASPRPLTGTSLGSFHQDVADDQIPNSVLTSVPHNVQPPTGTPGSFHQDSQSDHMGIWFVLFYRGADIHSGSLIHSNAVNEESPGDAEGGPTV